MPEQTAPQVRLPTMPGESYDLRKLNIAMDVILEKGGEREAAYALLHSHGWEALDAVSYSSAAQSCFDNMIDPNDFVPAAQSPVATTKVNPS